MFPLDMFRLVGIHIYDRSFTCKIGVLVKVVETYFASVELEASFEKRATNKDVLRKVSNTDVLKACFKQLISDNFSLPKITVQDEMFQLLL